METGFMNRIIGLVLALVVGGLLVGGLLIPSIEAMTATEKTYDNTTDALWQVDKLNADSSYEFIWDHTDPTHATVNGETVNLSNGTVICASDSFLIRYGSGTNGKYLQTVPSGAFAVSVSETGTNEGDVTITAENGTFTAIVEKSETTTATTTFTEAYGIVAKGNYVMKAPTQSAYMLDESPIFAMGVTTIGGIWYNMFQIVGNIKDGVTITQENPDPATYTISNEEIHYTPVSSGVGLNTLSSITFTATQIADSSIVADCTYNYFIVPATVTAELSQHMDATQIAMFGVISILGIVALVVVAANGIRNKY